MTPDTFTPDERAAIRLAEGQTFDPVYVSGGVLHGVSPAAEDFVEEYGIPPGEEATVEERKDQVRRRLFSVAVYCVERGLSVEDSLSKRRGKFPKEIRPSAEETARLIHLAKVFRARTAADRKKDLVVGRDSTPPPGGVDGATLIELYEVTRGGQIVILYPEIATLIHEEMYTLSFNDRIYVYRDGFYTEDKGGIAARIRAILKEIGYKGAFSVVRREVLEYLRAENPQDAFPFNKYTWHLPVKNGVIRVDPDTRRTDLLPHSPEYRFSYKLPVTYNPAADSTHVRQILDQWVEQEDAPYLLQVPAVAVLQMWGRVQKQAFLFEGPHDGGKTTYCEFLYGFFGDGGYSQVDLLRLSEERFALADLEHKLANIHDEMRFVTLRSVGAVKNLSGGLHHRIERKHENAHHTVLTVVHVFTCNTPPIIKEVDDDAFWSRWVYVVFSNRFSRDDGWKASLFTEENYSAFLNLVLEVVVAVMQNPDALKRMTADEVKQRWTEAADATIKFVWAYFERDADAIVPKDDVYQAYLQYCQENRISARAKNVFSSELSRMGIPGTRPREGKSRIQSYAGLRWKGTSPLGQGGQGILIFNAREAKEVLDSTGIVPGSICARKVADTPDHPDRDDSSPPDTAVQKVDADTLCVKLGLQPYFAVEDHLQATSKDCPRCIVRGCTRPPVWGDKLGNYPLCDEHYLMIKQARALAEVRP